MTTRVQARHRASARVRTPLTDLSDSVARTAGGAARTGAVVAAAGGLLVSVALPAGAATSAAPAAVGSTLASAATAVPAAFGTTAAGVVSAPATATVLSTTATFAAAPAPAPVVVAPVVAAPAIERATRTSDAVPVVASSVAAPALVVEPAPVVAAVVAAPAPAPAPEPAPAPAPAPAPLGQRILEVADDYAGVPYVYGGTTPSGFDCSGFTSYVYRQVGVEIPRTANAQKQAAAGISRGNAVPGDLVFFSNGSGRAYHVGIYAGGNTMWDAPRAGKPVQLRAIWSDAVTFGRLAPTA
ncbi:C40 family peptidase [Kineococcus radiotolerans]|uniref:NLP/P60 protein n=1 Tax=Kineococcus radiotolerans (strain ATCC BAA-149 / DSM 14245 / SRS30216) TaxID=266940 RepID=A6WDX6_KINRD|nr:C40 family peptidase [Kineococcus radiotolerans]ABS05015.1 NLP/P60 protein [Kineococcus radiotolerans SRS30216 = ATCC BAA-149]